MKRNLFLLALLVLEVAGAAGAQTDGEWSKLPPLQLARQECGTAVVDDTVYAIGGLVPISGNLKTQTVERWSPGQTEWSWAPSLPQETDHPAVAVVDGRIVVAGGFTYTKITPDVWILDPKGSAWLPGPSLPGGKAAGAMASLDGRLFHFGGVDDKGDVSDEVLVLEPGAEGWASVAPMPQAADHSAAVTLGPFIHLLGGRVGLTSMDTHQRYDPTADSWTLLKPLTFPRSAAAAAALGGVLWISGGELPMLFEQHEVYFPDLDRWLPSTPMEVPRHGFQAVVVEGRMILPGGGTAQGFEPTDHVDAFRPGLIFIDGFELGNTSLWSRITAE